MSEEAQINDELFQEAVKPLMKYLSENHHPHTKVIVDGNSAQMFEGIKVFNDDSFLID